MQCIDSYGDGWHGGYIEVLGNKYCAGFTSGKSKTNGVITVTYATGPVIHGKNVEESQDFESALFRSVCVIFDLHILLITDFLF